MARLRKIDTIARAFGNDHNRSPVVAAIPLPSTRNSTHIYAMAKAPDKPKKDPARPTRSKAAREPSPPTDPALARLLNPAIEHGTAGIGSGTGLQQPPDIESQCGDGKNFNKLLNC